MADERNDSREMTWRSLFPWTELFRGFQIALDPNKLFLAAIGIFVMAVVWWLLAQCFSQFYSANPPTPKDYSVAADAPDAEKAEAWAKFAHARRQWNLMHKSAGVGGTQYYELEDLVYNKHDYDLISGEFERRYAELKKAAVEEAKKKDLNVNVNDIKPDVNKPAEYQAILLSLPDARLEERKEQLLPSFALLGREKPAGRLSSMPWSEPRGPNPFLLVTGQAGRPWEAGHFWEWFLFEQVPVVIEPVAKLVLPLVYFFNPDAGGLPACYFFLVFIATVAIWSVVGGAITRIAAVQIARGEKIDLMEAVRFTLRRWASYLMAPAYPLAFIIVMIVFAMIFGLLHLIPGFGDIFISGIFWPIALLLGFVIALAVVGLVVGWPLMPPTISTEGTDSWEALSRSFSYVFSKPFHYLWYALVAIGYSAVLIFFIGFLGSFTVYLSKWAVSQTPRITTATSRDPVYLFVYAPDSFGWRELLLRDKLVDGNPLVVNGRVDPKTYNRYLELNGETTKDEKEHLRGWNKIGAGMVAFWLYLLFLLIIGFGYSLFWSLTTIIYFLLRRQVDAAEMDEVYLEEDEHDLAYSGPLTPPAPPPPTPPGAPPTMVESPVLRTSGPTSLPTTTPLPTSTPTAPPSTSAAPQPVTRTPTADAPAADTPGGGPEPAKPAPTDGNPPA